MREFFRGWKRKAGCVTLVMACILATGCGEQPMKGEPPLVDFTISIETRADLEDGVRHLLETVEDGSLSGTNAAAIQSTLDRANKIDRGKKTTRFWFAADGHQGNLEGHPVIYVVVQNKFNRVIQCGVTVPCW